MNLVNRLHELSANIPDVTELARGYQATKAGFGNITKSLAEKWEAQGLVNIPSRGDSRAKALAQVLKNRNWHASIERTAGYPDHRRAAHMRAFDEEAIQRILDTAKGYPR